MIAIGCDHAAYRCKLHILEHLKSKKIAFQDFSDFDPAQSVDYPDYALAAAEAVRSGACDSAILICGTGIGMSMAANKMKGIRCALCTDTFSARAARAHNNANVLALGARVTGMGLMLDIVDMFLNSKFTEEERHQRRIDKIMRLEEK